jgi:hypothetical protein
MTEIGKLSLRTPCDIMRLPWSLCQHGCVERVGVPAPAPGVQTAALST